MSSMFKKKGALAFKPKAPIARSRPAPTSAKPTPPPQTQQPVPDSSAVVEPNDLPEAAEEQATSSDYQAAESIPEVQQSKDEERQEEQIAPRRTTRRASQSQQKNKPLEGDGVTTLQQGTDITTPAESRSKLTPRPRTRRQSAATKPPPKPSIERQRQDAAAQLSGEAAGQINPTETPQTIQEASTTTVAAAAASAPDAVADVAPPRPAPKRAARKPPAAADPENAEGEAARPKKRQRKTARRQNDESAQTPARRKGKTPTANANRSRSGSRRARSLTPDDAEDQIVDLQKLKMSDLTKDLRIGKKFSRHDELRERERNARSKARPERDGDERGGEERGPRGQTPDATTGDSAAAEIPAAAPASTLGPQFRIVNDQIVVDQSSLVMDRHARAAAARVGQDMETIEENDFTRLITSSSFMNTSKLRGPNIWTDEETELFYYALQQFGTDFQMIAAYFPAKHRRHVKLKFNREERHDPARVSAAVSGKKTVSIDIDEYQALTGTRFQSVETIEAEQRKIQEEYEAERQRIADEQAETMRKKREELFADDPDGQDDPSRKKKKTKKGKSKGK